MSHPSFIPTGDPRVRAALETELALAAKTPGLAPLLRHEPDLWPRFAGYYQHLCHLPRRVRRALARRWRRSLPALALLLALGQAPALAATLSVAPGIPPDIDNDGLCALIEAIENANADAATHDDCLAGSGADTIVLPSASTQLLTAVDNTTYGETGLPVITTNITIAGKGSTIARESSAPNFRILAVGSAGNLTLNQTTVSGGVASGNSADRSGGGVLNLGGALTLTNSVISGNSAFFGGGGISNKFAGTVTLTNSTISGNRSSPSSGGGVLNFYGTLTLTNSAVSGNFTSFNAGGVFVGLGVTTLTNSTVSGNSANGLGGGLFNSGGTLTLTNSTVSGNSSDGVYGGGVFNSGTLTLTNSTVSGNSTRYHGGGLFNNRGTLTLTNSTVSGNSAGRTGGGVGSFFFYSTLTLARTLVSGNTAPTGPEISNYSGSAVLANNYNLFGHDGDAGIIGFTPGPTDIVPSEPLSAILDPLADNGGPTQTHALPAGSPAVDASPDDADCQPIDQRGVSRRRGAACDIGALEQGPPRRCDGKIVRIIGTVGNDKLIGTPGDDVMHGLGGRDVIHGLAGNDILCGGTHRDHLFGGSGADTMLGGSGNDVCNGGAGTGDTAAATCETVSGVP